MMKIFSLFLFVFTFLQAQQRSTTEIQFHAVAEAYVKLVLAVDVYDGNYVDAYYGSPQWQNDATKERKPLLRIQQETDTLLLQLANIIPPPQNDMLVLRHNYLTKQLRSLSAYVGILSGRKMKFDDEAVALYDASPPHNVTLIFRGILTSLDRTLPGTGSIVARYEQFKKDFIIPKEKLDTVFKAAIAEARRRTQKYMTLPPNENFVVEYVNNKPWSGYNWFKGNAHSVIQINTDLPIYIDRAIDLASHEGYPGHHVYNTMLEHALVQQRGWIEYCIYPLFSPQSLIAEGSANFGIEVAFPQHERIVFEKNILFPLAGLDSSRAEKYYAVETLVAKLSYAGNEAARRYLNGEYTKEKAIEYLTTYAMMPRERAEQRIHFFDTYRSYVINYNLGKDMVKEYIEECGGTEDNAQRRWEEFAKLISSPKLISGVRELQQ